MSRMGRPPAWCWELIVAMPYRLHCAARRTALRTTLLTLRIVRLMRSSARGTSCSCTAEWAVMLTTLLSSTSVFTSWMPCRQSVYASPLKIKRLRGISSKDIRGVSWEDGLPAACLRQNLRMAGPARETMHTAGTYAGPSSCGRIPSPGWYTLTSPWLGGASPNTPVSVCSCCMRDLIQEGSGLCNSPFACTTPPRFRSFRPLSCTHPMFVLCMCRSSSVSSDIEM
mmetsp:Transcript_14337/g.25032  ORF Transcript_14337/g.25032 Transcript_14337/m.25032 type:complete len:226 (+) Transcript_14337:531-1208(+)